MFTRRSFCVAALCSAVSPVAFAQSRTMRIVVSFPPGGPVDFVARALAEQLAKELGRTVIVDNRSGANGAIGANEVMRAPPDGSTLWITSVGAAAVNPSLYAKLPYDMQRDFVPVSLVVNNVELLVVNADDPAKDAAEFVRLAKSRKTPTTMASSGIGSIPHLAMEQLADATGAPLVHVPYKGAAPAIADLIGGQVSGFFGDIPGLIGHLRGGRLRAIGVASTRRDPALADVKTLAEQGIAGVDSNNWYALFAPAKTPPAIVDEINAAVRRALAVPALRDKLSSTGAEPAPSTPQALTALLKHDTEKWAKLLRDKHIEAE